jgi:hypothetical protein
MKLKSNFSSRLDFKPLVFWPDTVPAVALGHELLCGFDLSADHPVFTHEWKDFSSASALLKSIYPHLTLSELARLGSLADFPKYFDFDDVVKTYGFYPSNELKSVLSLLAKLPLDFQNLVSSKKMGPQELLPLTDLSLDEALFVTTEVFSADESRQENVKRIELLSDLLRMKFLFDDLRGLKLHSLIEKRYPVTSARDQSLQQTHLPWLSQIKSQFKRRGDKAGFEVQFFAGTPAELQKLATNLAKVAEAWNGRP